MRPQFLTPFAVVICLLACTIEAKTHAQYSGDVYHQVRHNKDFKVTGQGKQKLRVTMACHSNKAGSGSMRVYFYKRSIQGGWNQMTDLRIHINGSIKETSDTFHLPPGDYKLQIKVRRVEYSFKLEDA
ncbi:MAG: hypothetical protein ACPG4Q_00685 [Phycisphaeraceae bacterium]